MKVDLRRMGPTEREDLLTDTFRYIRENDGRLPFTAYQERVKTWHTPFVDLAIVTYSRLPKVLLERRPKEAHLYGGMLNVPGGNFSYRQTAQEAANDIANNLGFTNNEPRFCGVSTYVKTEAEVGISLLFVLLIYPGETERVAPEGCQFYSLNELPDDLVPWQVETYPRMIEQFMASGQEVGRLYEYCGE